MHTMIMYLNYALLTKKSPLVRPIHITTKNFSIPFHYTYNLLSQKKISQKKRYTIYFPKTSDELTKPHAGFVTIKDNQCTPVSIPTRAYFHRSRDRIKGKNENGAIFYYDSIEPDNEFIAALSGPKELLDILINKEKEWIGYIGRSKTSQYGKVKN